jgi:hypothetical protein
MEANENGGLFNQQTTQEQADSTSAASAELSLELGKREP